LELKNRKTDTLNLNFPYQLIFDKEFLILKESTFN